jgi:N-acetylglucosaminyldiphosphoundecaprenol N-acetyl-beta-D-mannosaminyltransferase
MSAEHRRPRPSDLSVEPSPTSTRTPPNRERVLGHPVNALSNSEVLALIVERALEGTPGAFVCLTNVATTMLSQRSPQLRAAVEGAYISTPDGMPLVWILRRRGYSATEKLTGADLMPLLAKAGGGRGLRHFFYGWTNRMSQAAARGLVDAVPGTVIAGTHCPPFAAAQDPGPDDLDSPGSEGRPLAPPWVSIGGSVSQTDWELEELEVRLEETRPHILWVGLGSPLQEEWMAMVAGRLPVPLMIGVGRAFNYSAGALRRCPAWMINTGLEWLYVFLAEPRRLWRRYIIGNTQFSYLIAREAIARKNRGPGGKG